MKYRTVSILLAFSLSGCAMYSQMDSLRKVADQKEFKGIDEKTQFSKTFPSCHSDPYQSVDQLNFIIDKGKYKGRNASALLVKAQSSKDWEVLSIMVEDEERWVLIPQIEPH